MKAVRRKNNVIGIFWRDWPREIPLYERNEPHAVSCVGTIEGSPVLGKSGIRRDAAY